MKFVHVKNLEKYNAGYKDREAVWGKLYFSLLDDYEFSMLHEIDKWRFVNLIIVELKTKKPVPIDTSYLEKMGVNNIKNRSIHLTLEALHNFLEPVTEDSKPCIVEREERLEREERGESVTEHPILTQWNELSKINSNVSAIRELTGSRKKSLTARMKIPSFAFSEIITAIKEQPFLLGENDRGWVVSFDWIIANDTNYMKVLERKYISNGNGKDDGMTPAVRRLLDMTKGGKHAEQH